MVYLSLKVNGGLNRLKFGVEDFLPKRKRDLRVTEDIPKMG